MVEIEDLVNDAIHWLEEGKDFEAVQMLRQAEVEFVYIDTGFELGGERSTDLFQCVIRIPRKYYDKLGGEYQKCSADIEAAFKTCGSSSIHVREFIWLGLAHEKGSPKDIRDKASRLKQIYVDVATGTTYKDSKLQSEYRLIRTALTNDNAVKPHLPDFVISFREIPDFWHFIQNTDSTYAGRRSFIAEAFQPLFDWLEQRGDITVNEFSDAEVLLNPEGVKAAWDKAKTRLSTDPDGAVTAAVTFLDTVIKSIHDAIPWSKTEQLTRRDDLPVVFRKLCKDLKLDSDKDSNEALYKAGQGTVTIVNSLASIRNREGDAHGKAPSKEAPELHLAELAVSLAGAIATYLSKEFQRQLENHAE